MGLLLEFAPDMKKTSRREVSVERARSDAALPLV